MASLSYSQASISNLKDLNNEWTKSSNNDTRLLIAPTAKMLKKGSIYYISHFILTTGVGIGVTDNFNLGIGVNYFSIANDQHSGLSFYPKFRMFSNNYIDIAIGSMIKYKEKPWENKIFESHYPFGVVTVKFDDLTLNAGLSRKYIKNEYQKKIFFNFGIEYKINNNFTTILEYDQLSEFYENTYEFSPVRTGYYKDYLLMYGLKYNYRDIAIDLAIAVGYLNIGYSNKNDFYGLPWVNFAWNIN